MAYTHHNWRQKPIYRLIATLIMSVVILGPFGLSAATAPCTDRYIWKQLRIGGGGWLTGIDISNDGATRVVRTDTYGAYILNKEWQQLVASHTMPADDVGVEKNEGVYEIRVAPNDSQRIYIAYRGFIYRSNDRGAHWSRTAFERVDMYPNDAFRMLGEKMAVDPQNPDVVYFGTPKNGLFSTTDGGAHWRQVSEVPIASQVKDLWPGITGTAFDPSSQTTDRKTNTIYASSYGNGVWRSTDAGASWSRISGGPSSVIHAVVAKDGTYYATDDDSNTPNRVWRFANNVWKQLSPPSGHQWQSVTIDPRNTARVVLVRDSGHITQSLDAGETWSEVQWNMKRNAPDIPWLAWTNENYMTNGNVLFDPGTPNELWFAQGIGVWTTKVLANANQTTWTAKTKGIEQLVANAIVAPPGGKPILASWDRALFTVDNPDAYPTKHGPSTEFNAGWSLDYASTNPSFIVSVVTWSKNESGYSTDKGKTWTKFATTPPNAYAGTIAASTPDNFVWVPSNRSAPYYTKDRGKTWHKIILPGATEGSDGLHWASYLTRRLVAADRVTAGTFYLHHTPNGLYRSQDGGASWSLMHKGEVVPFSGFNVELKAVPGRSGHLYFTAGHQSGAEPTGNFMRSTDGGKTWTAVPNVLEVYSFDFGKSALGKIDPALYIVGWVYGEYGIWRSDTNGASWARIGKYPVGSLDQIKTLGADKNTYGKVYLGFMGSGYAFGHTACRQ